MSTTEEEENSPLGTVADWTASSIPPPERIYIGGLDPPRLTAQDVLNRLPKDCVEILSVESSLERPYCHVTATAIAKPTSDKSTTALEIFFATFNNVKWKGCRLIVQAARPHFLELLEQERRHRLATKMLMEQPGSEHNDDMNPKKSSLIRPTESQIPRRLRVRKKFGDEAYHVDTKPWVVNDWSNFVRVMNKQRQKKEKQDHKKETRDSLVPVMYRAIHIRFDDGDASNIDPQGVTTSEKDEDSHSSPYLTETSDDGSSESDESISARNEKEEDNVNKAQYSWSDDDESLEDNGSRPNEGDEGSEESEAEEYVPATTAEHKDLDPNREVEKTIQESPLLTSNPMLVSVKSQSGSYHWSSDDDDGDDDSSDEENGTGAILRNRPFMPVTQSDEFEAGFDIHDTDGTLGENEDDKDRVHDSKEVDADLGKDVSTNLGILSSLFPDMVDTQPAVLEKNPDHIITATTTSKEHPNKSGFGASGIMLRYDPNDASTQQFEIVGQEENGETDKDAEQSQDNNDPTEHKDEANKITNVETPNKEPMVLYEEKKLEELFREAREAWKAEDISVKASNQGGEAAGGMFTFGFDLGRAEASDPKGSAGFSFGFDLPQVVEEQGSGLGLSNPNDKNPDISSHQSLVPSTATIPDKRRRGFLFPDDVITKYTKSFYALNNGFEIMKDVEAFRQDPKVKETWNKERHTLTIDWKRKQKHAQSRIQKKMKIR